jgi:hypothetical protein
MKIPLRALMMCALATAASGLAQVASAHGNHHPIPPRLLPPAAVLELEWVRQATARFHDIDVAEKEGYRDMGVFMPNMGWHYVRDDLLDGHFDLARPELLVYADDPCSGKRQLVAVEYAVPLNQAKKAPSGFRGHADQWVANEQFQIWTLHAWIWSYNPDGVFAATNPRVP